MIGEKTQDNEQVRKMKKFAEKLEAFRLSCKQVESNAEELEKFFREEIKDQEP